MGQGGEVRGHQAGVTDNGHSINSDAVPRECRLIARRDRYHRLEFASAFGAVMLRWLARDGLLDACWSEWTHSRPATRVRPRARHSTSR